MDSDDVTDYSDFEYQQIVAETVLQEQQDATGDGDVLVRAQYDAEPIGDIGGLDNNEVAELVYMEVTADLTFRDETADQDVATTSRLEGAVGVNLSGDENALPSKRSGTTEGDIIVTSDIDEDNVNITGFGGSDDRWLQMFTTDASLPFDDQTNGPGGSGSHDQFHAEKNFRAVTGRGPVLDSSDDISIPVEINVGDTIINVIGTVRVHMVWDVAETSDAGRRFSVPMSD